MTDERTFSDYVAVLKRRWKVSAAAGALVFLGFAAAAFVQTAVYEATATIQIEKPLIPDQGTACVGHSARHDFRKHQGGDREIQPVPGRAGVHADG
jgi:hypothetical protein